MLFSFRNLLLSSLLFLSPSLLFAQGAYVNPFLGGNFGEFAQNQTMLGLNVGGQGEGLVGVEAGIGYSPKFLDSSRKNSVLDIMGNVILSPDAVKTREVRPFVIGGLGLIRAGDGLTTYADQFGFNVGVGVRGAFTPRFGWRSDLKYFRNFNGDVVNNIDFGDFHFWRFGVGVTLK